MSDPDWNDAELEGALRLDAAGPDRYVNPRLSLNMSGKLFGGQFIANALSAAMLSAPGRVPRHFQGLFLRPGHAGTSLELSVERVHEGRRLSHRQVQMRQGGRLIFSAQVYLHERLSVEPLLHQASPPVQRPAPETLDDLHTLAERYRDRLGPDQYHRMTVKKAVQVRPVHREEALLARSRDPRLALWLRPSLAVSAEPVLQYAALAFLSDFWLCWPGRSPYREGVLDGASQMYSLDHSMWFHVEPPAQGWVQDWLLYEVESPVASEHFSLGRGMMYARDGRLLASCAQQALMD